MCVNGQGHIRLRDILVLDVLTSVTFYFSRTEGWLRHTASMPLDKFFYKLGVIIFYFYDIKA